jgi:outer membrane protein OmpA-like peptidoglycan-associated protein
MPARHQLSERVHFAKDSSVLDANAKAMLDKVASELGNNNVEVVGSASMEGQTAYNLGLAYRRADAVIAYLTDHCNVHRSRLSATSLGATGVPNDSSKRNVSFVVIVQ